MWSEIPSQSELVISLLLDNVLTLVVFTLQIKLTLLISKALFEHTGFSNCVGWLPQIICKNHLNLVVSSHADSVNVRFCQNLNSLQGEKAPETAFRPSWDTEALLKKTDNLKLEPIKNYFSKFADIASEIAASTPVQWR